MKAAVAYALLAASAVAGGVGGTVNPVDYGWLVLVGVVLFAAGAVLLIASECAKPIVWTPIEPWSEDRP